MVAAVAVAAITAASAANSADSARSAAHTQADAANRASAAQTAAGQAAYGNAMDTMGSINTGYGAYTDTGGQYAQQLSSQMGNLTQAFNPTQAQLQNMPGYQFQLQQGLEAAQNGFAARGLGVSGAAMKGAADYASGLASSNYLNDANVFYQNQNNAYNKLMGGATMGLNAANDMANNRVTLTGYANNALTGQANAAANSSMFGAQAQAAGQVGQANAYGNAVNTAGNYYMMNNMTNKLAGSGNSFNQAPMNYSQAQANGGY